MVSIFLIVCTSLCISIIAQDERGQGQGVNWDPFEVQDTLDTVGISTIKGLPLFQYWDVLKGSFRTGIIGDKVYKSFPQFVSVLEKKAPKGGKLSAASENYAIDYSALYMYSLVALQHLIQQSDDLVNKYELSTGLQTSKRNDFGVVQQKAFVSIEEMGILHAAQKVRRRKLDTMDVLAQNQLSIALRKMQFRNASKKAHKREVHELLATAQLEHFEHVIGNHTAKYHDLIALIHQYENTKLAREKSALADQYDDDVAQLRLVINATMDALSFRAAEELRVTLQQQKFEEEELLGTRSELLQAEVEEVINAFFAELHMWGQMVADDPSTALSACKLVLAGIAALLLVLELRQLCLSILQKLAWASYYPTVTRLAPNADTGQPGLRWPPAVQAQVERTVQAVVAAARHHLVLPNLLIVGASGAGKSTLIKKIMRDVAAAEPSAGLGILSVCGADLLALGDAEAALFLNNLIRKHSNKPSSFLKWASMSLRGADRLVIVVDDADCIIAGRKSAHQPMELRQQHSADGGALLSSDTRVADMVQLPDRPGTSSVCLFSLLAGLRENSPHISLVLAARMDVSQVDCALIDRIDATISVEAPRECERLACAVAALAPLLDKVQSVGSLSLAQDRAAVQEQVSVLRALEQALQLEDGGRAVQLVRSAGLRSVLGDVWDTASSKPHASALSFTVAAAPPSISAVERAAAGSRHGDPETDRPLVLPAGAEPGPSVEERDAVQRGALAAVGARTEEEALVLAALRRKISSLPHDALDLKLCLHAMLLLSARWSYRDLKQFFSALNYAIMCSER